jgi:hypothetical protein
MFHQRLKYLKRDEIDIKKWDNVIKNAINRRLYGYSWYLDIMTDKAWSAIVIGDYDAVFPILVKSKFIFSYVSNPYLCQQLGIFTSSKTNLKTYSDNILAYLKSKFVKSDVLIHPYFAETKEITPKVNHILELKRPYLEIYNGYNRNTKRNLKITGPSRSQIIESDDVQSFVDFVMEHDKSSVIASINHNIKCLVDFSLENKIGKILSVKDQDLTVANAFYILVDERIYFLLCASSPTGIEQKSMYLLIDYMIKQYAGKCKILDFTGSSIANIARRNEGFGAINENYFHLKTKWLGIL